MAIDQWSDGILVGQLDQDPDLADDLTTLTDHTRGDAARHVVLDFANVRFLNSSNLAQILKLQKQLRASNKRLLICGVDRNVWSVFLMTGLNDFFEFADNLPMALASLQLVGDGVGDGDA